MASQLYPYIPKRFRKGFDKGKLPLVVTKVIADFQKTVNACFVFEISQDGILIIHDRRAEANFNFKITKYNLVQEHVWLDITYAPSSILEPSPSQDCIKSTDLMAHLDHWKRLCNEYDDTNPHTDQELLTDASEIFEDIKIIDDDSDAVGFTVIEQLILSECIDRLRTNFHSMQPSIASEKQRRDIDEIFVELKIRIYTETKNSFMRRLAGFMAKTRRMGVKPGDWLFKSFVTEILLECLRKGFHFNPYTMAYYQSYKIEQVKSVS
jgi:hypothetical protein